MRWASRPWRRPSPAANWWSWTRSGRWRWPRAGSCGLSRRRWTGVGPYLAPSSWPRTLGPMTSSAALRSFSCRYPGRRGSASVISFWRSCASHVFPRPADRGSTEASFGFHRGRHDDIHGARHCLLAPAPEGWSSLLPDRTTDASPTLEEAPSPIPGVSRNVFRLGWVSLASDVASEMAYPLIPLFLTTTLGAPVAVLGVIEGVAEGTASTMKVASGWLSDRLGRRKPLVVAGYALSLLGKALLALAFAWPQAFLARFVDRTGKGLRTSPRDALIADGTASHVRGRAFGFHRAMDTVGAVVGPLVALVMVGAAGLGPRPVLLLALVPGLAGVVLLGTVADRPARPFFQESGPSGDFIDGPSRRSWDFPGGMPPFP